MHKLVTTVRVQFGHALHGRTVSVLTLLVLFALANGVPTSVAIADDPKSKTGIMKVTEIEGITEYKMENGVRVLLFPDPSKEVVTVNMTVFVGSRHEGYGEAGMAHLLEHMLFKGTPDHPEVPKVLTERGARFNGTTWMDRTNYYETLPASDDNLEFALKLESDRLVNSFIKGEDLESEMTVVRNEFESGENSPLRIMMQRMQAAAYEWHNYGQSTIGNRSDIERVPVVKLRQFYRKYYRPDNVMVIVAGKFEPDTALEKIQATFGKLKSPETPIDPTYTVEPAQDGERTVVLRRVGDVQLAGAAYHIPASSHPDFAAAKALVYVLGDEPSGRLYRQMVETEMASNVYALAYAFAEPGLFMTIAETNKDGSIEQVRQTLLDLMEMSFADNPVTEEEVERAKQNLLKQRELEANNSDRIAVSLSDWAAQGDWRLYFLFRDRVEALTAEQLQKVAQKYFVRNNRTVGLFIPSEKSERSEIPEAPNLTELLADYKGREAVEAGEQFDPSPLVIEQRTERGNLVDGIKYALLPKKTRGGSVSVMLTLRFGSEQSLQGKVGAVELLGWLMSKGTDKLDNQQLQDELTRLRAQLSINSTVGLVQMSVKTKREYLAEVIDLAGSILRNPRLDADELEVIRRQVITGLQKGSNDPQALAPRTVNKKLAPYDKTHVLYAPTIDEEIEMYEGVTVDQIKQLHREFLGSQAGELSVVGDFDPAEVKSLWKTQLENWSTDQPYVRVDRNPHPEVPGSQTDIQTPDKANAVVFAKQHYALSDEDPVYASLVLGNFVLGGGSLSSRLADRVRQQEGLSYGIGSGLSAKAKDKRVEFSVYAITNPGNKKRLVEVIHEEIEKIRAEGITEDELVKAKAGYLQAARVRRTDDAALAGKLVGSIFNGRTMKQIADHEQQIADATVDSVNQAIRSYIHPEKMVLVAAGDFVAAEAKEREAKEDAGNGEQVESDAELATEPSGK
ncbi:M16 family metallopeptidase [Planctomycetes bacterium K23_9]